MSDEVSELTRTYWMNLLLTWAEARLLPPQYYECERAWQQTAHDHARVAELSAELAACKGEGLISELENELDDVKLERDLAHAENIDVQARLTRAVAREQMERDCSVITTWSEYFDSAMWEKACTELMQQVRDNFASAHPQLAVGKKVSYR